ncbi:MAG: hypothetical protein ACJAWW_002496 [Sulfurimonas sp.]|jgi:hypothetical protein
MSNLKGSTFEKQIKNAKIRIEARGQSRHHKQDLHLTHSNALALKRDYYLKSFAKYATSLNASESKLNGYMTNNIVKSFLEQKTVSMSQKSAINFTRGFSALQDGLKTTGISVTVDKNIFDSHVNFIKQNKEDKQNSENRDIQNLKDVITELHIINPSFATLATLQSNLGIRVSESIELLNHPDKYIQQDNMIHNLIGKGNHIYQPKPLSMELRQLLSKSETVHYQSYHNALKSMNITSHDLRYTYVKNRMEQLLKNKNYKEALLIVSKEINHHRAEITEYYLSQTSF